MLLDLFCGAGGAEMGYHRAGFDVVGVDIKPQPHYPFTFIQADALEFISKELEYPSGEMRTPVGYFHAIHASPPCQAYSTVTPLASRRKHPDLIGPTRDVLQRTGRPYIIENVDGARHLLEKKFMLCGSMFGLKVWRHRWFECPTLRAGVDVRRCRHRGSPIDVSGTGGRRINRRANDHGGNTNKPRNLAEARDAMGIDWMTRYELSQAIPPTYTEIIGKQLLQTIGSAHAP